MRSFLHAYEAYERRVIRGEFPTHPKKSLRKDSQVALLLAGMGDILIRTGMTLKQRYSPVKPAGVPLMIGSKP